MAQILTPITDAVGSTVLTGFTKRNLASSTAFSVVEDLAVPGGKMITHNGSDQRNGGITVDAAGQVADGEILAIVEVATQPPDNNLKGALVVRAQDFTTGSHDYVVAGLMSTPTDVLGFRKKVAGVTGFPGSGAFAWAPATKIALRLRMTGTSVQARAWQPTNNFDVEANEPGTWVASATVTDVIGAGWLGFMQFDAATVIEKWLILGVGTNGDTAPSPAASSLVRPSGTTSAGGWTPVGAATLHEATDEESASFTDHALSPGDPTNAAWVVDLPPFPQPPSPTDTVILPVAYDKQGPDLATLTIAIWQPYNAGAGTLIATRTDNDVSTIAESGGITLSSGEAAAIVYTSGVANNLDAVLTANTP